MSGAAPTLRRDLRHAPLKRPCSRPGSYQRSSGVPAPGDNTPRIINDRAGKSYQDRRPGPDHRGLPNMVMGRNSGSTRAVDNRTPEQNELIESERRNRRLEMEVDVSEQAAPVFARKQA